MAFADPQSVTVSGTAVSLPRTGSGVSSGTFTAPDNTTKLTLSHTYGKRTRRQYRLDFNKIAADPLTAQNARFSSSAYVVIDHPIVGFTSAELIAQLVALADALKAGTNSAATKLVGGES